MGGEFFRDIVQLEFAGTAIKGELPARSVWPRVSPRCRTLQHPNHRSPRDLSLVSHASRGSGRPDPPRLTAILPLFVCVLVNFN